MILAITDLHMSRGAAEAAAERIAVERPEAVLVAGDISHGDLQDAEAILEILRGSGVEVFFVPGNMDSPKLSSWSKKGITNLHGRCENFKGYTLAGLGGSVNTPFNTPFEMNEQQAKQILEKTIQQCSGGRLLLLSHSPPKGTDVDMTSSGIHAGSTSVRDFVESRRPALVVCGHIHEAQGLDTLGETVIVNPGPAYRGGYARIKLDEKIQVELARFKPP